MFRQHINRIKAQIDGKTINKETAEKVLATVERSDEFLACNPEPRSQELCTDILFQIIHYIYHQNIAISNKLCEHFNLTGVEKGLLAEIAFDIARWKNNIEVQYFLASNFLLDEERITDGILVYIISIVDSEDYNKASELMQRFRNRINRTKMNEWTLQQFTSAMTFKTEEKTRDYTKAYKILEIYRLDHTSTYSIALGQYEYNMNHKQYLTAAELGKKFQLGEGKTLLAAYQAFEEKIQFFRKKLTSGGYPERFHLQENDPFSQTIWVAKNYNLIRDPSSTAAITNPYVQKAHDIAYYFIKQLIRDNGWRNVSLFVRYLFTINLITEFYFYKTTKIEEAEEIQRIIVKILSGLDGIIKEPKDAEQYIHILLKIFQTFRQHKSTVQQFALRLFTLTLKDNKIEIAYKIFHDFQLQLGTVMELLENRCLILLEQNKSQLFLKIIDEFDLVSSLKNNRNFIEQLYEMYKKAISRMAFETANIIQSRFPFSRRNQIDPVRSHVRSLLLRNKDKEVLEVLRRTSIRIREIRSVLLEMYKYRTTQDCEEGPIFRRIYGLTPMDIGIITWFFSEILRWNRIKQWLLGREISPEHKKKDNDTNKDSDTSQ